MDRNPRVTFLMHRAMGCALLCAAAGPALCQSVPGMSPAVPGRRPPRWHPEHPRDRMRSPTWRPSTSTAAK